MDNKKVIIQEEIVVNQNFINKVIKHYEKVSDNFCIGIGEFTGKKNDIIREIKKLSEIGKRILLIDYQFEKWLKKQKQYKKI